MNDPRSSPMTLARIYDYICKAQRYIWPQADDDNCCDHLYYIFRSVWSCADHGSTVGDWQDHQGTDLRAQMKPELYFGPSKELAAPASTP